MTSSVKAKGNRVERIEIVAWDNLTVTDWASDGMSHAYYLRRPGEANLYRVCEPRLGLGMRALAPGSRLQPHVPELPLCPRCAGIAGVRVFVRHDPCQPRS